MNVLTLGGLALVVGIVVDDASIVIEKFNSHLKDGVHPETAFIDAANQIEVPISVRRAVCLHRVMSELITGLDDLVNLLERPFLGPAAGARMARLMIVP